MPSEDVARYTTHQHKTHITVLREVFYPWHPWHGRHVHVIEGMTRRDRAVFRCRLEPDKSARTLELPQWMLDRAECCRMQLAGCPAVGVGDLRSLQWLLEVYKRGEALEDRHSPPVLKGDADAHATEVRTLPATSPVPTPADDASLAESLDGDSAQDADSARKDAPDIGPWPCNGSACRGG
jgi:hypothetical protein